MMTWKQLLVLSIFLLGLPSTGRAEATLVIATGELPPYVSVSSEDSFLSDLFDAIGREMGVRFEFRFMPWKRCENAIEELSAWGAIPYVSTPERQQKFDFSEPLFTRQSKFFYYSPDGKPKDIAYKELSDLKSYRIGGVRGYFYEPLFTDAGLQVEYVKEEEQNFRKLKTGRADLAPAEEILGWYTIKRLFPPEEKRSFFTLEKPLQLGSIYLMASKLYPDGQKLMAQFNTALKTIKSNGVYQRIAEKHELNLIY